MKFQTNLHKNDDKSFLLEVEIPKKEVKSKYEEIVAKQAQKANVKGFRKGKAPVKVVEEKIGQDKLKNILVEEIIKEVYPKAIKNLDLNPIIHPQIDIKSTELENDWEINFTSAELPEVEVNTLYDKVKEANTKSKIWKPGEEIKEEDKGNQNKDKQIQKIIDVIIKNTKINLPKVLIDQEISRKLTQLIDQVNQAGMQLEQYLSSKGITIEELKEQYRNEIINSWKIDLVLEKISDEKNIEISEEDTKKIDDSKMNPYIAAKILRRQKTLEYLLTL